MRGGDVFLGQCAAFAFAEKEAVHLLDEELLGFARPGLQTVLVEEHLLALDPFAPRLFRDVVVDLVAEVGVERGLVEAFHFGLVLAAEHHVWHLGGSPGVGLEGGTPPRLFSLKYSKQKTYS
jgi:hypothetical protein